MLTGLEWQPFVKQALGILKPRKRGPERTLRIVRDYDAPNVSEKIVRIIMSYTDYVNRTVWYK